MMILRLNLFFKVNNPEEQDHGPHVAPFPTSDKIFAHGVAWEMFRQKLIKEDKAFADIVIEEISDWLVNLAHHFNRAALVSSTDWPGWSRIKVGPKKPPFGRASKLEPEPQHL